MSGPLTIGPLTLANRSFLAPLSGITDVPFRRLARRFGAGLVVSEMVASGEFARGVEESRIRAMRDGPGIHAVQLAGRDPHWMGEATRRLVGEGVDLVDINMGCPAKKVVGGLSGSALMREPDLALSLVEATVAAAGSVPVTLKTRLGWDRDSLNAADIARRAQEAGVAMVTIHGRTRCDFYEGRADWPAISAVRAAISVPLVANGDLAHPADVAPMLAASGADAAMSGRGCQGRPWLPGLLAGAVTRATLEAISYADLVAEHYAAMLAHYGSGFGLRHARKHLGWYLDRFAEAGCAVSPAERGEILRGEAPDRIVEKLRALFAGASLADIEPSYHARLTRKAA
ncbi:tRNA dihydrouridine synthase DusB [Aurantimonas sp. Leaf443]|uniref:tRNA dihydrouridine synthase DusB n=1 Tax=Aurantimonas sp. Leaf443 TaxID=1736378 RepID=UPI0006FD7431|nr:tRNA dihydrouridine synthase DusB [Aurantimonas sp. Leaf443]KQT83587.1 tRNA-dihydrouridine synthase [Aurantimonas sp. Leaf443]